MDHCGEDRGKFIMTDRQPVAAQIARDSAAGTVHHMCGYRIYYT